MKKKRQQVVRKQPAYMTIIGAVTKSIKSSAVPEGAVLSEGALASLFGFSRAPVRQAFAQLEEQGLVHRFDGRGVVAGKRKAGPVRIAITAEMLGLAERADAPLRNDGWDLLYYEMERDLILRSVFGRFRVNELALARHFSVGRTVARNLLLRAQTAGILKKDSKAHWYVIPLDENRVNDLYDLRRTLEPLLIETAVVSPEILAAMAARLQSVTEMFPTVSVAELDELETDIHVRCLSFGHNLEMMEALKRTHCSLVIGKHIQAALIKYPQIDPFMHEHLAIIHALQQGDGSGAAKALHLHLDLAQKKAAERFAAFRAAKTMPVVSYIVDGSTALD